MSIKILFVFAVLVMVIGLPSLMAEEFGNEAQENEKWKDDETIITESEGGNKTFIPYSQHTVQFTINAGVGISWYQMHFTGGIQVDYQPNPFLGLGLKSTVDYGFRYGNLHVNIFVLYKLWWLYLGPGVSFQVIGMTIPGDDPEYIGALDNPALAMVCLTAGLRFPFARVGPGHLTLDISIDWYQTDYPLTGSGPPYLATTVNELLGGAIYAFKPAVRLGYTF